ncbi:hypothetical protein BGP79_14930 [Tersicoccus sp. Bi-70]|nr:hypothetical protein BGP79_14930 [Tersicoccus sp. Bi-70]
MRSWQDNREQVYNVVATLAATLVISATVTGSRPSDVVAAVADSVGLTSVDVWLRSGAPPFISASMRQLHDGMVIATVLLFVFMALVPVMQTRHDDEQLLGLRLIRLLGSPAASTLWILLLIAAQHGSLRSDLAAWRSTLSAIAAWAVAGVILACVAYASARRSRAQDLIRPLLAAPIRASWRLLLGASTALIAVLLAAIAFPLAVASWMCALESDSARRSRRQADETLAQLWQPPSGAKPMA